MSHVKVVKVSVFIKQKKKKKTVISSFTKVGEVGIKKTRNRSKSRKDKPYKL